LLFNLFLSMLGKADMTTELFSREYGILGSGWQNHRIIKWFGFEGTFNGNLVQLACHRQGHVSLDKVDQSPIQDDFEHF